MRYTTTSQQLSYFQRESHIDLKDLFTEEEIKNLKNLLDETLAKHKAASPTHRLLAGHDLQRENPAIYKALQPSRLGQVASQLFNKKKLLIALTQYYLAYGETVATASDISSYTEICGCMLMNLSDQPLPDLPYLPVEHGDVVFYKENFPIEFTNLDLPILLVVFATDKSRYRQNEKDPHKNHPKKLGLGAGDRLTTDTHPLIIQQLH